MARRGSIPTPLAHARQLARQLGHAHATRSCRCPARHPPRLSPGLRRIPPKPRAYLQNPPPCLAHWPAAQGSSDRSDDAGSSKPIGNRLNAGRLGFRPTVEQAIGRSHRITNRDPPYFQHFSLTAHPGPLIAPATLNVGDLAHESLRRHRLRPVPLRGGQKGPVEVRLVLWVPTWVTRSSSSRRTPTIRPPKMNSGPTSIKPSSIASSLILSSATPWWPGSAKSSPTTEAGEILSPTLAESQNNPSDLVQTNHFRLSGSLRFPPPPEPARQDRRR